MVKIGPNRAKLGPKLGTNRSKWGHNGSKQMADIGQNGFEIGSVFGEAQAYAGVLFHHISSLDIFRLI